MIQSKSESAKYREGSLAQGEIARKRMLEALDSRSLEGSPSLPLGKIEPTCPETMSTFFDALNNDSAAQITLGKALADGHCAKSDPELARKWLELAAEKEPASAGVLLGILHGEPFYGLLNKNECLRWLRVSAEKGNAEAQMLLGVVLTEDARLSPGRALADERVAWLKKAAEQGQANAMYLLAKNNIESGELATKDSQTFRLLSNAAGSGVVDAMNELGGLYEGGGDYDKALYWYGRASRSGSASAYYKLFEYQSQGRGTVQNYQAALNWLKESAAKGYEPASLKLAELLLEGQHLAKNIDHALVILRTLSRSGNTEAKRMLKQIYSQGETPQSPRN